MVNGVSGKGLVFGGFGMVVKYKCNYFFFIFAIISISDSTSSAN
jgi:hypothetical protein